MKTFSKTIILSTFTLLSLFCSCNSNKEQQSQEEQSVDTIPVLITQIQKCSRLYAAEYKIRKIITHQDEKKLEGSFMRQKISVPLPIGERKIAIPVEATVKAYIDLSTLSTENIHRHGNQIEIILPDPQIIITSTKIKREDVKEYVPILRKRFTDEELTVYEHQGRKAIVNDISKIGIIERARENAAVTLIPMIELSGFKQENITISFRKKFTLSDIATLIGQEQIEHERKK